MKLEERRHIKKEFNFGFQSISFIKNHTPRYSPIRKSLITFVSNNNKTELKSILTRLFGTNFLAINTDKPHDQTKKARKAYVYCKKRGRFCVKLRANYSI
jgi:hypothetical protein